MWQDRRLEWNDVDQIGAGRREEKAQDREREQRRRTKAGEGKELKCKPIKRVGSRRIWVARKHSRKLAVMRVAWETLINILPL